MTRKNSENVDTIAQEIVRYKRWKSGGDEFRNRLKVSVDTRIISVLASTGNYSEKTGEKRSYRPRTMDVEKVV